MNDFKVLLQAVLDSNSVGQADIAKIQKAIQKYHLNLAVDLDKATIVNDIKKVVPQLEKELKKLTGVDIKITDDALIKAVNQIGREAEKTAEKLKKINKLANGGIKNDYSTQIAKMQGDFRSLGLTEAEVANKTKTVSTALQTLKNELAKPVSDQNFETIKIANDAVQRELAETTNVYTTLKAEARGFATEQQRLTLANTIEAWNQKNSAATKAVREQNEKYIASLRELDVTMDRLSFDKIKTGFKEAENSMRGLGRLGATFREQWQQAISSFTTWLSASTVVMKFISETREAVAELKTVNTYLTEISKANDKLSKSQLNLIGDNSFDVASDYGKVATDYLSGVQEASRAGYDNAESIAKLSLAIQGAGDVTDETANKYVIATDKAYQLKGSVEELTKVFDGSNYITNKNAVNMTELAEGMSIVGSTASSFNVDVQQTTAALGTMVATTQLSGSEMARAFRAILLNIRQVSDEEEGIDAEGLTKYEEACNALNVKLKETKNGVMSLRDPMEVISDLAREYNKLDEGDIRRTNLLSSVGGKLRANALDALLKNQNMYNKMLREYEQGMGSMEREAAKTANSWEGSMNRLSNTWTDTVGNIADSDAIITGINTLNDLLQIINKITDALGSWGSIALGAGLFAGFKNVGIDMLVAYLSNRYCFELPTI